MTGESEKATGSNLVCRKGVADNVLKDAAFLSSKGNTAESSLYFARVSTSPPEKLNAQLPEVF